MMTANEAFEGWLLKVEIIGGAACLLSIAVGIAVAIFLVANSRKKKDA